MKYSGLMKVLFTAGLMLLFSPGPMQGGKLDMSCNRDKDCPPGYVCNQNACLTDPSEDNICDPLSEENESCPDSDMDLDELESGIKSGEKDKDTNWDF